MKTIITLAFVSLLITGNCFAQQVTADKDTAFLKKNLAGPGVRRSNSTIKKIVYLHKLNKDTTELAKSPLYILKYNAKTVHYSSMAMYNLLDAADIQDMEILQNHKADSLYPGKGKYGVIIITVKKNIIPTISKTKLLEQYNIKKKYHNLPIYIDSAITSKNDNIFATHKIKTVTVAKDKETGKKYISILTNNIRFEPDPNVIYIRGKALTSK